MLASADSIEVVAEALQRYDIRISVVDPVRESRAIAHYSTPAEI